MDATPSPEAAPALVARPRVLAMANQKGGVGKTTTAINLGTALAAIGERVLILDLDPQGNASTGLGIDRKSRSVSSYDMLVGERTLRDVVMPTAVPRLFIVALDHGPARRRAGDRRREGPLIQVTQGARCLFRLARRRSGAITYVLSTARRRSIS